MMRAQEPHIIVAEEGKLVALRNDDDNLAINRASGSAFTLNNWQQGYGINEVVKPLKAGAFLKKHSLNVLKSFVSHASRAD